ncbi:TetR/AcrR family transcriptional regulator [Mycobacterium sp. OTB74]|jgi:AcrR family transcriptional regulator|uniref:TetR/AcrR family transcriptional regulator n=1 Tax=Mycobacterium sp. OTB74 TaxID=1853452 RepID=UPI002474D460|nr:TetR/AcrR family transcriptional regulator [Mycobacterium sp. OTB74]MDH6244490.1 AcrR family transcriptional regulator [Mycobacterium sp. OTB74]
MARKRRGWGGEPPASDAEAAERIVATAVELLSSTGKAISIADVAESLGVIRQTVYRYFPTADELMRAAAIASVDDFLDQLTEAVRGIHDPADAMTEGMLYSLDAVARTPHLGILISSPYSTEHSGDIASEAAQDIGMRMITRFDVNWDSYGYDEAALRDLVEFTLRVMLSYFVAPNADHRSADELRAFLTRWLGGAILAQRAADPRQAKQ